MSAPQQPDEIPYRQVDHGTNEDLGDIPQPAYWPSQIGFARREEWWGTPQETAEEFANLERIGRQMAELGGFGFRASRT